MKNAETEKERIVKRLVEVHFYGRGMGLSYLCEDEGVKVGDLVTVEGKLEGLIGKVKRVLKSFKIPKFEMKWINKILDCDATGDYFKLEDDIISFNSALTSEKFYSMYVEQAYNSVEGLGEADMDINLENFEASDFVESELVMLKGKALYQDGCIAFISLKDGIGKAYALGSQWYEIDFKYAKGKITYIACECPYFGNCKHEVALLFKLREIFKKLKGYEESENFVLCRQECFYSILSNATGKIIVGS